MKLWSGLDTTVHVLDGSAIALRAVSLNGLGTNIRYHHLPVSIWARFAAGAALVDTEYAAFLADDEFFIPSAVEASICELENDRTLVACCGIAIDKSLTADLIVPMSALTGEAVTNPSNLPGAAFQESSAARMIFHMNPYSPSAFYGVCRSTSWKEAVLLFTERTFSSGLVAEMQFELFMSFSGKIKITDRLMWLRSAENPSNSAGFELGFDEWFLDKNYKKEVDAFLDLTAGYLARQAGGDFESAKRDLLLACDAYIEYCGRGVAKAGQPSLTVGSTPLPKIAASVLQSLKPFIRKVSSSLLMPLAVLLPHRLRFRPYLEIAKKLESNGFKIDWIQFAIILKAVKQSHAEKI